MNETAGAKKAPATNMANMTAVSASLNKIPSGRLWAGMMAPKRQYFVYDVGPWSLRFPFLWASTMTDAALSEPITITLTRYREPDWLVMETLESLSRQEGVNAEVLFLDQHWRQSFAAQVEGLSTSSVKFECLPCDEKGLSHARNRALAEARTDIVLFIDSDAVADPAWARELSGALNQAVIAGGRILPQWHGKKPFLARSRVVCDQYSILDWGAGIKETDRVVGASFGIRKSAAPNEMRFDENYGRRNGVLFGGEETDLCRRVREAGGSIVYCGAAVVDHQILPDRLTWSWVMKRLYFAGVGRRQQGGAPSPSHKPGFWDWALLPVILPPYALGYFAGNARAD